ncbi:Endonuclease/Exonuclease/phosphatase family protein [Tritrichomonas foetus]|uniref:sphingomyelin phosphodiesterase n=1 Tax=Tritrichomonas foetus TaxID=1144522 RepID=A0A1J4KIU8_9EUKA|nr:Endonuclease/Exonuclease/phosphatase family protein [Tritrichomonas foetus]|eukprot:OHT09748.1 Endonuclease/Exonuclease/phosphatase family protein [Tritrichomonas foetus]
MVSVILLAVLGPVIFCLLFCILKLIQFLSFKPLTKSYEIQTELPDEKKTLKMLQYNVFWRPWLLHLGTIEHVRERARLLVERLVDYDFVCLNESFHFGSDVANEFMETMKTKGFKYIVTSRRVPILSKFVIDSGVMILSKYPIVDTDSVTYSDGCNYDGFAAKGCVYAKIQISKKQHINVFATHLQASYTVVTEKDYNVRANQIKDIHSLMSWRTTGDNSPTFLLGDMNIDFDRKREYSNMMESLDIPNFKVVDTLRTEEGTRPITIAVNSDEASLTLKYDKNQPKSIDYIFVFEHDQSLIKSYTAKVEPMPVQGKPYDQLSDHCAVSCNVELK